MRFHVPGAFARRLTVWRIAKPQSLPALVLWISIAAAVALCYVAARVSLWTRFDFNGAYNIAVAKSIGTSFAYTQSYIPWKIFSSGVSANGPIQYIGGLGYALGGHNIDAALVAGVVSSAVVLAVGFMLLRPWFSIIALALFFIYPVYAFLLVTFNGYIWAAGAILVGLAILRGVEAPLDPRALLTNRRVWLAALFFSLALASKLISAFAVFGIAFAVIYDQVPAKGWSSVGKNSARAFLAAIEVSVLSWVVFFAQVVFATVHTMRSFGALVAGPEIFVHYVKGMVEQGQGVLGSHPGALEQFATFDNHVIVVLIILGAIALAVARPSYTVFLGITGFLWLIVGMDQERMCSYFVITLALALWATLQPLGRLAVEWNKPGWALEAAFLAALAACVTVADSVVGVAAVPRADSDRVYAATDESGAHYGPALVRDLREYRYVVTSGYWEMAEISNRWALQFYDRIAPENAYISGRDPVLLFDRGQQNSWPVTSERGNCASIIYGHGPIVLCHARTDVPLDYQPQDPVPGATWHSVDLSGMRWVLEGGMRRAPDVHGTGAYAYVRGSRGNGAAALNIAVRPGQTYVFSVQVDPSAIIGGEFALFIDTQDEKSTYSIMYGPSQPASRFLTTPWICPQGVTGVRLGMQAIGVTVAANRQLKFALPVLSSQSVTRDKKLPDRGQH